MAALVVALAVVAGVVWAGGRGSGARAPAGRLVAADRGEVAVTVGGIGHVSTLSGAARLAVPAAAPSPSGAGGGSGGSGGTTAAGGGATATGGATASGGATQAPADAIFPAVAGHIARLLVHAGERVVAGQPIATLSDDGATATGVLQARSDLATARLELAQKRVHDPALGLPPTPQELDAGRQAVLAARDKLRRVVAPPRAADVAAAGLEVAKAVADLQVARAGRPDALASAELTVAAARQKLQVLTGAPDPAEVATAQLELAKATLDQETLLRPAEAPSASAVRAADLAIELAQQHLADAQAGGTAADVAAARAELAKAQSERETLAHAPPAPTDAARAAAQLAVDAAQRRLDALVHPPAAAVATARAEVAKAQADLAAAQATRGKTGLAASRAGVTAARRKLAQLLGPPTRDVVSTARFDVRKARADLAVLRQRGGPASATDLALARLKVDVGAQRLALAHELAHRLTVLANASGTVTSVLTATGAAVDPTTPVARVQDLDHLVVTLDLSEFDVGRTRIGAPARISVDALGGRRFGGRVLDVALTGNDTGGVVNFPVTIGLRSGRALRPGMSVSARIVTASHPDVIRIPLAAVADREDHPGVMVRDASGALVRRPVELGLAGAQLVEVRSGLRAGERVLVPHGGGA